MTNTNDGTLTKNWKDALDRMYQGGLLMLAVSGVLAAACISGIASASCYAMADALDIVLSWLVLVFLAAAVLLGGRMLFRGIPSWIPGALRPFLKWFNMIFLTVLAVGSLWLLVMGILSGLSNISEATNICFPMGGPNKASVSQRPNDFIEVPGFR